MSHTEELLRIDAREARGRLVREAWVAWAKQHPSPKPYWLVPWDEMGPYDQEADRRIGDAFMRLFAADIADLRLYARHTNTCAAFVPGADGIPPLVREKMDGTTPPSCSCGFDDLLDRLGNLIDLAEVVNDSTPVVRDARGELLDAAR